jgi:hypothetical protein
LISGVAPHIKPLVDADAATDPLFDEQGLVEINGGYGAAAGGDGIFTVRSRL